MIVAIIGSRRYRNKEMLYDVLEEQVLKKYGRNTTIISGKCPMIDSVDNWAINWASQNGYKTLEYPSKENKKESFFDRNRKIAEEADRLIVFIPRDQHRSGAWNCVNWFRKFDKTNYQVYDEKGELWDRSWSYK